MFRNMSRNANRVVISFGRRSRSSQKILSFSRSSCQTFVSIPPAVTLDSVYDGPVSSSWMVELDCLSEDDDEDR